MNENQMTQQELDTYTDIKKSLDTTLNNVALAALQIRDNLVDDDIDTCVERIEAIKETIDRLSSSVSMLSLTTRP